MKFQGTENSERCEADMKHKTKGVILITDNRPKQTPQKGSHPDFRQSAFKQTEVDPMEIWAQMNAHQEQESLIEQLNQKLLILQERVKQLQKSSQIREGLAGAVSQQKDKKHRRKFDQMQRKHKCNQPQCDRIYGSETSLKHHLKIKHKINYQIGLKQNEGSDIRIRRN